MNLLYISNEYPPETGYGGIGTYAKHIAEGMAAYAVDPSGEEADC